MPSNKAMKPRIRLVENTDADTVGAVSFIPHPELKAFFTFFAIY